MKEILFSGGWDSTFMLCQMAREECTIQPHYINFSKRKVANIEIERMKIILDLLPNKDGIKANILPLQIHDESECNPDQKIINIFNDYKHTYPLGWQYLYLSEFAKTHKNIALGQERYYTIPGHLTRILFEQGHLQFDENGVGYLPEDIDPNMYLIFGNYTYPVANLTELEMYDKIKEWGYEDIMKHVWFCYAPINNKPCGICYTCDSKMKQRMFMLFSDDAIKRYKIYTKLKSEDPILANNFYLYIRGKLNNNALLLKNAKTSKNKECELNPPV